MTYFLNRIMADLRKASVGERVSYVPTLINAAKRSDVPHANKLLLLRAALELIDLCLQELGEMRFTVHASLVMMGPAKVEPEKLVGADGQTALVIPIDFKKRGG